MSKKMLRSVLAVAFSAGLVSVALGALSLEGDGDRVIGVSSHAAPPPDLAWDTAPAKQAGAAEGVGVPPDMGWDFAPVETDRA
ncbi:hypothetical protein ABTY35_06195 [Streptomyces fimicarius]|uniref:hypothetical protein n=1 Tax=Streptomyces TaxID=1883 RepID=UPI0015E16AE7|nr:MULTISPECIES: hypothetical protein [unclassified Streptomyces]